MRKVELEYFIFSFVYSFTTFRFTLRYAAITLLHAVLLIVVLMHEKKVTVNQDSLYGEGKIKGVGLG